MSERKDRREFEKHIQATGMDKSLDEYFNGLKDLPKGPIRQRRAASSSASSQSR